MSGRVDQVLADPLADARAAPAAIGYVGFDLPEDLLEASGRRFCHLPWQADRSTPWADQWLETSFPGWTRSIAEDWAAGRFDFLEAVVFSRGDDGAQRLYYYLCELQRRGAIAGPPAILLDMAKAPRASSTERTIEAVRGLAGRFGIGEDALAQGIATVNRRRAMLEQADAARSGPGAAYERLARATLYAPVEQLLDGFAPQPGGGGGRLLLTGSVPPDDRLHRAAEEAGWNISGESHDLSLLRLGAPVAEVGDPVAAIGESQHARAIGARTFADRAALLLRDAERARADAAILWLTEEEEALVWHVPAMLRALEQRGLPVLAMTRRRWDGSDGAAAEIAAFLKGQRA